MGYVGTKSIHLFSQLHLSPILLWHCFLTTSINKTFVSAEAPRVAPVRFPACGRCKSWWGQRSFGGVASELIALQFPPYRVCI